MPPFRVRVDDTPPASRRAARLERVLAVGRAFLTVTGFVAIYLDPTEPARLQELTYAVLFAYAAYSLAILLYVQSTPRVTSRHGQVLHGLDIVWTSALTIVSEGPVSPFFLFFLFVMLAAAYRWGFRETVGTAAVTVGVFLVETAIVVSGPWSAAAFASGEIELNRTILRVAYLLMTGVLLGYLAEQEKHARGELAAVAAASRQHPAGQGLGGALVSVARTLSRTFEARSAAIVVHEQETRRTLLWQLLPADAGAARPGARRTELDDAQRQAWLFPDPGRAWHAARKGRDDVVVRATEPDAWPLRRAACPLPPPLLAVPFRTVMAVNMGMPGEWEARAYLFDAAPSNGLERRLHFLEALAEHVTPALTNVFLLRRLRARAGAAERARVARELHDGAIQSLFGIEMKIEAMRREGHGETLAIDLEEIQALLRREVLALRELMQALRPIEFDTADQLPDVLSAMVERFRRDTGISARFVSHAHATTMAAGRAVEFVRIVQEALVNVRKHSNARNVLVRFSTSAGRGRLVIEDDGRGFPFEGRFSAQELEIRRLGPTIIRERARIAGAELTVDSTPGSGSRVELSFCEESHA